MAPNALIAGSHLTQFRQRNKLLDVFSCVGCGVWVLFCSKFAMKLFPFGSSSQRDQLLPLALCALSISHSHSCLPKYSGIIINAIHMHTPFALEREFLFSTFFFHTIAMFNRISSILCTHWWLSVCGSEKMFLFLALLHGLVPLFIAYQRLFLPNELRAHNVKPAWDTYAKWWCVQCYEWHARNIIITIIIHMCDIYMKYSRTSWNFPLTLIILFRHVGIVAMERFSRYSGERMKANKSKWMVSRRISRQATIANNVDAIKINMRMSDQLIISCWSHFIIVACHSQYH